MEPHPGDFDALQRLRGRTQKLCHKEVNPDANAATYELLAWARSHIILTPQNPGS
jgi:hypothetical protein